MPTEFETLRQMHFKKNTKRIATPIAIPTTRSRPPSSTHIDLTHIDQSPSSQQRLPARTTSASAPFKPPTTLNPRFHPSKKSCTKKTPIYYPPAALKEDNLLPTPPQKKFKPNRTGKPSTLPNRGFPNLPLPQILAASSTSNPSRYPSANHTKSTASGSARNPSTSSRPPNTHAKSSSTSQAPLTRTAPFLSVSRESSSPPKASSSRTKPSKIHGSSDTRDSASTLTCLSDFQISTRSPSSDAVSIVSSTQTPPINVKADMQKQLSVFGLSLQTDRVLPPPIINQQDADPEESSLEISQIIDNPECLCPFCDELLPTKPSHKLVKLLKYLKSRPEVTQRSGSKNPFALYLPFPQSATYCERHRAEKKLIPMGIRNGWPTEINFQKLPRRIKSHRWYLQRICKREIASDFMDMALKAWAAQGPMKVQSVANELATFHVEQPGYYGVRGYEVIYLTLHTMFLGSPSLANFTKAARPLSPDFLIRKVLVPETALCLIADDLKLKVTDPRVRSTLEDSRTYGAIMFPDEDDEISEDQSSFESDDQSLLKSDEAAQASPPPAPKSPAPSKKRPRKSESCEIEIIPSKVLATQRFRPPPTSPDQDRSIDQIRPTFQANLKQPSKRPGGDASRPIYPPKALKSGWKSTLE